MYRRKSNKIKWWLEKRWTFLKKWLVRFNWGKIAFLGAVGGVVLILILFIWVARDLPDPNQVQRKSGYSTVILDREGEEVLFDLYVDENRKFTPIEEVPEYFKQATVAVEDKDFYEHKGFDLMGMARGLLRLFTTGRAQGGSTLTQQLVKNALLTSERTVVRKIKEFVLAIRIESRFSKDEILQMYFNETPYGGTAWGVAAAAEMFFDKEVSELDLVESVVLAGLPQSPTRYSPYGNNPEAYIARATVVARRMNEDGYINDEIEAEVLASLPEVEFQALGTSIHAGHFVMHVRDLLEEMYGEEMLDQGGWKITTTLNWDLQAEAEEIVAKEISKVNDSLHITNGASVIVDTNNGEVLSMVGSKDFFDEEIDGEVNVVTRLRQPGSSIKPLVYATAFSEGYNPSNVLMDTVTEFPGKDENTPYEPKNYDGEEHGLLHLRDALASSINVPAVKLLALVGVKDVLSQGYKMGLNSLEPTRENLSRLGLSMALGGGEIKLLEMATAYSAFANGGSKVEPVFILKIEDPDGKVVYEHKPVKQDKVLDEKVAFLINDILSDNNARLITFGVNSYLNMGDRAVAVKTGTTNNMRDNWTIGWTRDRIVGVWVGNNDNSAMKSVASGVSGASPIWRKEMLEVLAEKADRSWEVPSGVEQVELDGVSGYLAHDGFGSYVDWIISGTLSNEEDPIHKKIKVCKGQTDKLAGILQVAQGNYEEKEVIYIRESDPLTDKDLWQKAIDGWISRQADDKYKVPTEYCEASEGIDVQITSPGDKSRVDGETVTIRFEVSSDKEIDWAKLYIDDVEETKFESLPYLIENMILADGQHTIRVLARDVDGRESDRVHEFGMNEDWSEEVVEEVVEE